MSNKKDFKFDYDNGEASAHFKVDLDQFDDKMALTTLNFFSWGSDEPDMKGDLIEEAVKKYASMAIIIATNNNVGLGGVIREFEDLEGYADIDGSCGIELVEVSGLEYCESLLELEDY